MHNSDEGTKMLSKLNKTLLTLFTAGMVAACTGSSPFSSSDPEVDPENQDPGQVVDLSKPVIVAVLTPNGAGGPLEGIGNSIANGARLAEKNFNKDEIELRFYPTGGDPARAGQLAEQAVSEGAAIVVGPLKSEEIGPISQVSNVPIFSFSNNAAFADENIYIFGTTFENIANRVLAYQKAQGGQNLGIVYQNDIGGTTGAQATINAAQNERIQVVAQESYDLTQQDIESAGSRIAQSLRNSGADMVMFTDNPAGGLGFVGMALRDNDYTSSDAQFMGLSRWDEAAPEISKSGFNNGIFAIPDPYATTNFRNQYSSNYGSEAHTLAGLGYDATLAVIGLVRDARETGDDTPFGSDDVNGREFKGANGAVRISKNIAQRALAIMQIQGDKATLLSNAPDRM